MRLARRKNALVPRMGLVVALVTALGVLSTTPAAAQPSSTAPSSGAPSSGAPSSGASSPTAPTARGTEGEDPPEGDLLRTIRAGDTLDRLARRELDHPERWRDVAAYNQIANPRRISPGTVVRIKREWLRNERAQARIEAVGGAATVDGRPAQAGTTVGEGARFETQAQDTVVLSLPDGTQLRIAPDSRVRLERLRAYHSDRAIEALIHLETGGVEPESPPNRQRPLEIRTPAGNAAVRGTSFRVRAEQSDGFIEVLRGSVAADSRGGDTLVDASNGALVSPVRPPLVEALLPAPYLATQWQLPLRTPRFELDLPPVPGAAAYRIEVARDAGFVDVMRNQVVTEPKVEVTSERDGPLHLRVRAVSGAGIEGYDAVSMIRVAARPVPPTLAAQVSSADAPFDPLEGPVTLSWTIDPPPPQGSQRYLVQLAADDGFTRLLGQTTVTGHSATLDLPPTAAPTTRYWRVAAIDAATGAQGPFSAPQPLRQRAPAVIERATPVPSWRDSSGAPLRGGFGGQVQPGY